MKMLWTSSKNPIDFVIRLMTGQDCQHFAFLFESAGGGMIFECNLLGAHACFYNTWLKKHALIHVIDVPLSIEDEDALWDKWVNEFDGLSYDFLGVIYLGIMFARKRIFGIPLPAVNAWSQRNQYFCDAAYQLVSGRPGFPLVTPKTNGMATPHALWEAICSSRS